MKTNLLLPCHWAPRSLIAWVISYGHAGLSEKMRISFFSLHSLNKTLLKTNLLLPCQCWPVIMDMQGVRLSFAAFSLNYGRPRPAINARIDGSQFADPLRVGIGERKCAGSQHLYLDPWYKRSCKIVTLFIRRYLHARRQNALVRRHQHTVSARRRRRQRGRPTSAPVVSQNQRAMSKRGACSTCHPSEERDARFNRERV